MLYDLGHRHFGLVTISEPMTFRHLHKTVLLQPSAAARPVGAPRRGDGAALRSRRPHSGHQPHAARPDRPTAVIALFDELALTVMEEAARAGLSVPRDLSVIGFDNVVASAYAPPGLTLSTPRSASARARSPTCCSPS